MMELFFLKANKALIVNMVIKVISAKMAIQLILPAPSNIYFAIVILFNDYLDFTLMSVPSLGDMLSMLRFLYSLDPFELSCLLLDFQLLFLLALLDLLQLYQQTHQDMVYLMIVIP